ncbi:ABC transporter permease, partial [Mammaliicoccus fleurettii]
MADKRDEKLTDDHSNAVMTHTSEGIPASDFIRSEYDIDLEPDMQRVSNNFCKDAWTPLNRNNLLAVILLCLLL